MTTWLKRVRGALVMGVIWAVIWMPVGLLIGQIVDPDGAMDEPWILVGTYPGFLAGVLFSAVLGLAARRRRLDELSVAKFARWGAIAGVVIGAIPVVLGDQSGSANPRWWLPVVVVSAVTLLSSVSAAGSLILARKSATRELTAGAGGASEIPVPEFETERVPWDSR